MKAIIIVAMDKNRGIGKDNNLMWHLPADMKFFKESTVGQIVVMGRKNFESIPEKFRPLPGRENAILSRNQNFIAEGCQVFNSLEECVEHYRDEEERIVYIIGGGQIYDEALRLNIVSEMLITHVDGIYDADIFFSEFDSDEWEQEVLFSQEIDDKHKVEFEIKRYLKK